jgi:hypothetical protein
MGDTVKSAFVTGGIGNSLILFFIIQKVTAFATFFMSTASCKVVTKPLVIKAFVSSQKFNNLEIQL